MAREVHDDTGLARNHETTESIPILATRCVECGKFHRVTVHSGLRDLIQARWCSGLSQLTSGGWLSRGCLESHADRSLQPARLLARTGHTIGVESLPGIEGDIASYEPAVRRRDRSGTEHDMPSRADRNRLRRVAHVDQFAWLLCWRQA